MGRYILMCLVLFQLVQAGSSIPDTDTESSTVHPYAPGVNVTLADGWQTIAKLRGITLDEKTRPPELRVSCPGPTAMRFTNIPERIAIPSADSTFIVFRNGLLTHDYEVRGNEILPSFRDGELYLLVW